VSSHRLQQALGWLDKDKTVPRAIVIAVNASIWMLNVDSFRQQEDAALVEGRYGDALDEHRAALSILIGAGEGIVLDAKQNGIEQFPDFKLADLVSTIESLRLTFRCQHEKRNSRSAKIAGEIFDAA